MRGTALVLTVAFVFASTTVLLAHAAGQSDAMPPEYCCSQPPPDATLSGLVTDGHGNPVAGASVSVNSWGPIYYETSATSEPTPDSPESSDEVDPDHDSNSTTATSTGSGYARPCCYSGGFNSTVTGKDGRYSLGVWSGDMQVSVYRDGFASASAQVHAEPGDDASQDFTLKAFPAKTAHVVGKITDAKTGKGIGFASLSVRSPLYGLYECSWTDADRQASSGSGSAGSGTMEPAKDDVAIMPYPYNPGCAISVHSDGSFDGNVTPGYTIVSAYAWQDCSTSRDADGSTSTSCGPEYLPWTKTLDLPANQTTRLDIRLPSRPAPDATVSGYLVDAETGQAIPGASISFSNQETYAYGSATTDHDGSYSLRLRSGYHSVSVYANGYLSWEGVLQVPKGSSPFDVELTPGQESYGGGCCYAYAMDKAGGPAPAVVQSSGGGSASAMTAAESRDLSAAGGGNGGEQYEDLGGGLGPYDAEKRADALVDSQPDNPPESASKGSPGAGLLLTGLAFGLALVAVRRRLA